MGIAINDLPACEELRHLLEQMCHRAVEGNKPKDFSFAQGGRRFFFSRKTSFLLSAYFIWSLVIVSPWTRTLVRSSLSWDSLSSGRKALGHHAEPTVLSYNKSACL
jgi:hypothetical protein